MPRPFLPRLIAPLFALLTLAPTLRAETPATATAPAKSMCWKISSPTATLHIVGSMHLATKDMYPLPDPIEAAFAASKGLVVEIDPTNADDIMLQAMDKGVYKSGSSLADDLDPKTLDAFKAACDKYHASYALLGRMRPWMASTVLSGIALSSQGFDTNLGIDMHFINAAKKNKLKILELESATFQIDLISGFSKQEQQVLMTQTLDEVDTIKDLAPKIKATWLAGDLAKLTTLVDPPAPDDVAKAINKKMLDDRNVGMIAKIETYLKGSDPLFIVVGAGHLAGDKGILAALQAKGYKIEQLPAK